MKREEFLGRVREAAASGRRYRSEVDATVPRAAGYGDAAGDLVARLALEIEAVGGHAHVVADDDAAREELGQLLERYAARQALLWKHEALDELRVREDLEARNVAWDNYETLSLLPAEETRRRMLAADVGITSVDYAIAETGSLALFSGPGHERTASLLPPVHIALVRQSQILADLVDLFDRLEAGGVAALPSNLVFVTGPSKTGDIELKLTTGVHGPRHWHVIVIR